MRPVTGPMPYCAWGARNEDRKQMSKDQEKIDHQHIEEKPDPEARIFVLFAGALMVVCITFGLLNTLNVIHM
jgi:hypothetical protein